MAREAAIGKKYVDLHVHSTYSDGTCTIREIIEQAFQKNLRAISITDHDCIDGYPLAKDLGSGVGLEVMSGVELSSEIKGGDIHVLGYCIDIHNAVLNEKLKEMKEARFHRAKKIVSNLNRQGVDLQFETVLKIAGEGAIGRPHIAAAMLKEELIYSFREAFEKFIGYDSPAYVEKMAFLPKEVMRLILDSGGLPVLAHPGVTMVDDRIEEFVGCGLAGIEAFHSEHTAPMKKHYLKLCQKHNLAFTGGSDFHSNTQTKSELGVPHIAYSTVDSLKEKYLEVHGREMVI